MKKPKHQPRMAHAKYHAVAISPKKLKQALPVIKKILAGYDFDAIAFRGLSGTLLAMPIAMATGKTLLAVRKPGEKSHSAYRMVQGDKNSEHYIIVDDFQESGETARAIMNAVSQFNSSKCLGILEVNYLFHGSGCGELKSDAAERKLTPVRGVPDDLYS